MQWILDDKSTPQPGEEKLASLTAGDRYELLTGMNCCDVGHYTNYNLKEAFIDLH